jgi:chromatin remodeling complex protein RSC6
VNAVADRVISAIERTQNAINAIKDLSALFKEQMVVLKVLQRDVATLQKENGRRGRGGHKAAAAAAAAAAAEGGAPLVPRKPSGFAKPAQLTGELCAFLGVPDNTLMARTDVTRLITKYVKDNKLHNEADKRTIQPDGKLLKLLAIKEEDKLTYFNLQSHIKHHFIKDVPAAAPVAVAVA